jgi:mono/diheme cytochrome c family protein
MSEVNTPREANDIKALFPLILLVVVTAIMVFALTPRTVPNRPATAPTEVAAAAPTEALPVVDANAQATPTLDHLTLMAFGMEEVPSSGVRRGQQLFNSTCTACHGFDAKGISGLGKTLIDSAFVDGLEDDELVTFIQVGRTVTDPLNTTGVAMPANGNNPSLTDADLNAVVDYIRSLNGAIIVEDGVVDAPIPTARPFTAINVNALDPSLVQPSGGASGSAELSDLMATPTPTIELTALPTESAGTTTDAVSAAEGETVYFQQCVGCHGAAGVADPLFPAAGDFTQIAIDPVAAFTFMTTVQQFDPVTIFVHPYRGGYPELTDDDIKAVISYMQSFFGQ